MKSLNIPNNTTYSFDANTFWFELLLPFAKDNGLVCVPYLFPELYVLEDIKEIIENYAGSEKKYIIPINFKNYETKEFNILLDEKKLYEGDNIMDILLCMGESSILYTKNIIIVNFQGDDVYLFTKYEYLHYIFDDDYERNFKAVIEQFSNVDRKPIKLFLKECIKIFALHHKNNL